MRVTQVGFWSVFIFWISACGGPANLAGSESGSTNQPPSTPSAKQNSFYVSEPGDLPTCGEDQAGELAYVSSESKFYGCHNSAWAEIDIQGEKGDAGEKGDTGDKGDAGPIGAAGKDGSDNRIISSIHCRGQLTGISIYVEYDVSILKSGDVFVFGSVRDATLEIGASKFYSSQQVGAETASVIVEDDLAGSATAGFWTLSLDRSSLISTIVYKDFDVSDGEDSWSQTPDKCTVNKYD